MSKTMKGIDISKWEEDINLTKVKFEFLILKATEGVTIKDRCFKGWAEKIRTLGKPWGFYHFARPENNSAIDEAHEFYKTTKKYIGKGIPILDWESKGKSNVAWAKKWLDEIYRLTGVKPMIYMSESTANDYNWSSVAKAGYKLWVAKYRDYQIDRNYDMSNAGSKPKVKHWNSYVMWQWTDRGRLDGYKGNLDCNVFYGDRSAWDKLAAIKKPTTKTPATSTKKTYSGTFPKLPSKGYLAEGDKGTQVKYLQEFLNWYGGYKLATDGKFGPKTDAALRKFQKAEGLVVDGKFGPKSLKKAQAAKK